MEHRSAVSPDMSVNDTLRRFPATVAVFNAFCIDACCGGAARLDQAAERDGADPARLLEALNGAAAA